MTSPGSAPIAPQQTVEEQTRLGMEAFAQGRLDDCIALLRGAVDCAPGLAEVHNNLGVALHAAARHAEATRAFQSALAIAPDDALTHHHLGLALQDDGRLDAAADCFRRAVEIDPLFVAAHNDLGVALIRQGQSREGLACLQRALEIDPRCADALANIGLACEDGGLFQEAFQATVRTLQLNPDHAEAHTTLGMMLLRSGTFAEGWAEYEWRWRCRRFQRPKVAGPLWDGSPLEGRTLLLTAEQGIGDTIQFWRYGTLLAERGDRVIGWCPPRLVPLLSTCPGYAGVVADTMPQPIFDVQASVMSMPGLVGTRLETIPARVPYLFAEPERLDRWRRVIDAGRDGGLVIGVAWQGNTGVATYSSGRNRSFPPEALAAVTAVEGVRILSLQAGPGGARADLPPTVTAFDAGLPLESSATAGFVDTAAAILACDLVISCDTSIAHLAGALGAPVWVALPFVADWRWLLDRDDSPWYPSMRLFRQPRPGDWTAVFDDIAACLRNQHHAE
jgi:Flp pilus assembly protein TadD